MSTKSKKKDRKYKFIDSWKTVDFFPQLGYEIEYRNDEDGTTWREPSPGIIHQVLESTTRLEYNENGKLVDSHNAPVNGISRWVPASFADAELVAPDEVDNFVDAHYNPPTQ